MNSPRLPLYRGAIGRALHLLTDPIRGHGLYERSAVARKVHQFMIRALGSRIVESDGFKIEIDELDTCSLTTSPVYEPAETQWYEQVLHPGDTVVEIGANIGYFTLRFSRLVGPAGRVVAYEADPKTAAVLRRNVARNGLHNVDVRQVAVTDHDGEARLYRSLENGGDHRLFTHGKDGDTASVRTVSLDSDLKHLSQPVALIKMDIQGAEPLALSGMRELLASSAPRHILMEFWPFGIVRMGRRPEVPIKILRDAGYDLAELGPTGQISPLTDDDELLARLPSDGPLWANLVCTHRPHD